MGFLELTVIVFSGRLPCGCQDSAPAHQLWRGCVLLQPEGTAVAPTGKEGQERQIESEHVKPKKVCEVCGSGPWLFSASFTEASAEFYRGAGLPLP